MMNSTNNGIEDLITHTQNKLEALFQNNQQFNIDFISMYNFYQNKLHDFIPESDMEDIYDNFFSAVKSQFFNGYFMVQQLLNDDELGGIENDWLKQHEGFIMEQIPSIIRELASDNFDEAVMTDDMRDFIMDMITKYENVRKCIKQIAFDICCLGFRQGFLDERDKRGLESFKPTEKGILSSYGVYDFLTPQTFLVNEYISADAESWVLNFWSSMEIDSKAGEISVIQIPSQNRVEYALNIYLYKQIPEVERTKILEILIAMVMENNNVARNQIRVNYALVEEFMIMVQDLM